MKNLKSFYLLALAAALAFTGCKKDDGGNPLPGTLTIEKTEYALDAVENRTATVAFTAAASWTLSVVYDDAESAADWLTVTQAAASDDTDFTTLFDPDFAKELQKQGIIADAENITPEDMAKIATMTELDVSGTYENPGTLTSLQGIEYFESLTQLSCYYNQLTSLDISANTALTTLWCYNNSLTSLDVSGCTALTELSCPFNQLTSLDLSANTALTGLSCSSNQLTTLDVSANTALTELSCENNQLTTLDISANTALTELYCYGNQLTSLDVSANMALTWLTCSYNSLETLDISKNTALTQLDCSSNSLTTLDVSANTALTWLSCENNPGDRESKFPITAWFDNQSIPDNLEIYQGQWTYDGKSITIDFRKAE